jgi:predicted esterase YcpF (UPF0227 family)
VTPELAGYSGGLMDELTISPHMKVYRSRLGGARSRHAVIAFGGISLGLGMPEFEFFKTLTSLGIDALFIRDPGQGWYQRQIPGLGDSATEISENISAHVKILFPNQTIITIGNSMGGYAALMFGCLCGFEKILTFCPQTFISPDLRTKHGDHRWQDQIDSIEIQEFADVAELLNHSKSLETHIYVGKDQPLDLIHAQRVAGVKNVAVHLIEGCGHNVSQFLLDSGRLNTIIDQFLA